MNGERLLNWLRTGSVTVVAVTVGACGFIKEKPPGEPDEFALSRQPMPPEKAKEVLNEVGGNFVYGPGLGEAAVNVGTVVAFPPYALFLVGNAILSVSGYEPITVSGMLPEEEGKAWSDTVDEVVSGPGRVVAAVAGKEYRSRELARERLKTLIAEGTADSDRDSAPHLAASSVRSTAARSE